MFNLNSTTRAKRVARDLQAVLAEAGLRPGYSACLEMAARMLGHPSFGMMSRSVGHALPTPDDAEASIAETAVRRALHIDVLTRHGIPEALHDAVLERIRPTGRSSGRARPARRAEPAALYGCAWFDEGSRSGWACLAGGEPIRFADPSRLDPGVTWWTTLSYDERYKGGLNGPNLLHDRHFTVSPLSALREHGMDLSEAGSAREAARLAADVLGRVRGIADAGVSADAHRSVIRAIGAGWKDGHGTDKAFASPNLWEEFVATAMRGYKGGVTEVHREPRLGHARAILAAQVPVGAYEHVDLEGNPVVAMRRRFVEGHGNIAFVRARLKSRVSEGCPIRSILWIAGDRPAWVAKPVYDILDEVMDLEPLAAMVAPEMRPASEYLPECASAFIDRADPSSWADGIVAETIWRSGLSNLGRGAGPWQTSLAAAYLRAVDVAAMCRVAIRLRGEGASVSSYGLGWVRYMRPVA